MKRTWENLDKKSEYLGWEEELISQTWTRNKLGEYHSLKFPAGEPERLATGGKAIEQK